ncbi:SDR family NAD(P)-dependent oxidoreductase, partial [Erwinia amylovora]|uniref:SDR family NAD(P)-dependent oxidoreductase n=1 Tax=Erwinia amylovora TaxID=552 RepID=UPI0020C18950
CCWRVAVNFARRADAAHEAVQEIKRQGGSAFASQADISNEDEVVAMFACIDRQPGRLATLANNAGILFQQASLEQLTAARLNQVFATNVTGCFICCREA